MRVLSARFPMVMLAVLAVASTHTSAEAQFSASVVSQNLTPATGTDLARLEIGMVVSTDVPNDFSTATFTTSSGLFSLGTPVDGHYQMEFALSVWNDDFGPTALDLNRIRISLLHSSSVVSSDLGFVTTGVNEETSGYFADPPTFGPGAYPTTVTWNDGLLPAKPFALYPAGISKFETLIRLDSSDNLSQQGFSLQFALGTNSVPEIDPAGMASVWALIGGAMGLLERRRRKVA